MPNPKINHYDITKKQLLKYSHLTVRFMLKEQVPETCMCYRFKEKTTKKAAMR